MYNDIATKRISDNHNNGELQNLRRKPLLVQNVVATGLRKQQPRGLGPTCAPVHVIQHLRTENFAGAVLVI